MNKRTYFALTRSSGRQPDVPLKVLSDLNEFVTKCVYTCEDKTYCEHCYCECISCCLRMRHFRGLIDHWRLSTRESGGEIWSPPQIPPTHSPPAHVYLYSRRTLPNYQTGRFHHVDYGSTWASFCLHRYNIFMLCFQEPGFSDAQISLSCPIL